MRRPLAVVVLTAGALLLTACTGGSDAGPSPSASRTTSAPSSAPGRPNIVFVLTDDLAWNLVSQMPQVLGLEKAGITFPHYDVVDSLCCPSRTAILTGEYPHDDGVFTNSGSDGGYNAFQSHDDGQRSFALALQQAGYRTGFMGKYLNGYLPKDGVPAGWNEWDVAGNGYPEFHYNLNEDGKVVHYGTAASDYMVDVLSAKGASFIDSSTAAKKPFFLEVATFAPHAPYTPAPRYAGTSSSVAYPKTPAYDTLPSDPPSWLTSKAPLTAAQETQLKQAYDKRVEADKAVDDLIQHLRDELSKDGVAQNTYVVFSSDNGYHMGEYRLLAGKQTAYDTDIDVPLVVVGPGVPAGREQDDFATNIDLAPTFETLAGAAVGSHVDGVTLAGLLHGQDPSHWQQGVLIEHHGPDDTKGDPDAQTAAHADPPSYEAVRTATALYVQYANGDEEYYDTATDPYELKNLGGSAAPASIKSMLAALESCHSASACQAAAGAG